MTRDTWGNLLTPDGVCELIPGMTKAKLAQMRFNGTGPAYMKPTAKTVVYEAETVMAWLKSTMRAGTSELAATG